MSDESDKLAFRARKELDLTQKAFDELRAERMELLLASTTPEEAFQGVMAVRALDEVLRDFAGKIQTPIIEKQVRDNNG